MASMLGFELKVILLVTSDVISNNGVLVSTEVDN